MKIHEVDLPEIAIIGKLGFCSKENNIVEELWNQANHHFGDVAALGMKENDGSYVGFWGAMSDESMSFLPWEDHFSKGYYLAGIEVYKDAVAPAGWTKWIMPARKYIFVEVQKDNYKAIFEDMILNKIPEMGYKLVGAVCDYTKPSTGINYLFFPVK